MSPVEFFGNFGKDISILINNDPKDASSSSDRIAAVVARALGVALIGFAVCTLPTIFVASAPGALFTLISLVFIGIIGYDLCKIGANRSEFLNLGSNGLLGVLGTVWKVGAQVVQGSHPELHGTILIEPIYKLMKG